MNDFNQSGGGLAAGLLGKTAPQAPAPASISTPPAPPVPSAPAPSAPVSTSSSQASTSGANPVIVKYLSDTSIPIDIRRNIAKGLNSGDLTENAAITGITSKYGDKYGAATPTAQNPDISTAPSSDKMPETRGIAGGIAKVQNGDTSPDNPSAGTMKNNPEAGILGPQFNNATEQSTLNSPGGKFLQAQAPELQDAMKSEVSINPIERAGRFIGQLGQGAENIAGGVWNMGKNLVEQIPAVAGAVKDLATGNYSKEDTATGQKMVDKSTEGIQGLNQVVSGAGQIASSPLAVSPVLQKGLSLPFEAAKSSLGSALKSFGIDPESEHGKSVVDSLVNALSIAVIGPKNIAEGVTDTIDSAKNIPDTVKNISNTTKSPVSPEESISKTTGQIIQGKTADIAPAARALNNIDTTGVKTYSGLSGKLAEHLSNLKDQQDAILSQDPTTYKLSNFDKEIKAGDTTITTNPVRDAISQLKELYQKTNAPEDLARITDLAQKAEKYSLTLKDVNDIAREYGTEFGKKAFDKKGDPLTSVNAQAYENTRAGVKNAVRDELPNDQAKQLDKQMSDAINTKNLTDQMAEKVNSLKQKVQERGLGEKIGRGVGTILDIGTGHAFKGFIEKFLSRGTGLKTLNPLDLESFLSKNLETINKLSDLIDKDPAEFVKTAKGINLKSIFEDGLKVDSSQRKK